MIRIILSTILIICTLNFPLTAQEQTGSDLVFDKIVHDFGDFLLSDGKKSCTFTYTNRGTKPIVIQTIIASCGCTDPQWDKAPIMPGKSGTVKVTFLNNQGPYPFDKTLAVYSTASDRPITLRIRGAVHEKSKSISELFPVAYGHFRLRTAQYHLRQIAQGESKGDSVQIVNNGKTSIEVTFTQISKGLSIDVVPNKLKAGQKGYLRYRIDTRAKTDWGVVTYSARPVVNGKTVAGTPIEVSADIRDNFKNYSKEQISKAPILLAENTAFRFGNAKQGTTVQTSFTIINKGQSPLLIHKATPSHPYLTVEAPKEIAPGQSGTLKVSLDTSSLSGEVISGVTLITNVPSRPALAFVLSGTIVLK